MSEKKNRNKDNKLPLYKKKNKKQQNIHMVTQQSSSGDESTMDMYFHEMETKNIDRRELLYSAKELYVKQRGKQNKCR